MDYQKASMKVLEAVRGMLVAEDVDSAQGETIERVMVKLLGLAWADAVRAEWQAFVDADPELKAQHAVAVELMREDRYDMAPEPVCGLPGAKPMVATVDGQEAVCFDRSMVQATPLSAIYVNKVRIVQSAAARVAKRLGEEAAKAPPQWPITIASGESFNSLAEMEASSIDAVRDAARMFRDAEHYHSAPPAPNELVVARQGEPRYRYEGPPGKFVRAPEPAPTCWQHFEFDGPVPLDRLAAAYRGKLLVNFDPALVSEIHQQYQNCLKEIGQSILNKGEQNG